MGLGQKLSSWKTKAITRRQIISSAMNVLLITKCGVLANGLTTIISLKEANVL